MSIGASKTIILKGFSGVERLNCCLVPISTQVPDVPSLLNKVFFILPFSG